MLSAVKQKDPPRMPMRKLVAVRVSQDEWAKVKALADLSGRSVSGLLRFVIRNLKPEQIQ